MTDTNTSMPTELRTRYESRDAAKVEVIATLLVEKGFMVSVMKRQIRVIDWTTGVETMINDTRNPSTFLRTNAHSSVLDAARALFHAAAAEVSIEAVKTKLGM